MTRVASSRLRAALVTVAVVVIGVGALAWGATRLLASLRDGDLAELQKDVDRAARHAASRHRAEVLELVQLAQRASRSELLAVLGAVEDALPQLYAVEAQLYKEVPGAADAPELVAQRKARVAAMGDVVDPFAHAYAARVGQVRSGAPAVADASPLVTEGRALLTGCLAIGVNNCLYRAAFDPLRALVAGARELGPDLVVVVDEDGVGRADQAVPTWSDRPGVAAAIPVLAEALASRTVVHDFARVPGHDGYFVLAAAPLMDGTKLRGAVLVGRRVGGPGLARDAALVGHPLTWVISGAIGTVASTLDGDDLGALDGESFITGREAIAGNVTTVPTIVAAERRGDALQRWDEAELQLWLFAAGVAALLATALILFARSPSARPKRRARPPADPSASRPAEPRHHGH
ncbi:MAG: hypothetical protein U1F43_11795 [Myxococcota bacterium]